MAEKVAMAQRVQVGVETTPGTAVAAGKLLQSVGIAPAIKAETQAFKPHGYKYPTLVVHNREWVEAKVEVQPTFDELVYPLSSVLTAATVTTPGGTAPRLWTFDPASQGADAPKTYTVEFGEEGTGKANRFAYGIVTGLDFEFARDKVSCSGSLIGQAVETGVTLTASPATLPQVPISGKQVSVYMDDASSGLGTTKLARVLNAKVSIGDRHNPVWVLDRSLASFAATVEGSAPKASLSMLMAADDTGMGLLPVLRAGDTRFVRIEAEGATIESTYKYRLRLDLAVKVSDVKEFSDEDGLWAIEYEFAVVHDGTWGRALKVEVQNTTASL